MFSATCTLSTDVASLSPRELAGVSFVLDTFGAAFAGEGSLAVTSLICVLYWRERARRRGGPRRRAVRGIIVWIGVGGAGERAE
jgi:hypothetical protein